MWHELCIISNTNRRKDTSMKRYFLILSLLMYSGYSLSEPFETCPSKAYLFQSNPVQVYGVNLVTGSTALLQGDTGLAGNINGVGFDFDSRYIYGYDTTNKQIVRLGDDFQYSEINTIGLPTDYTFYVGDVYDKHYYLYRKGKGLFRIDLAPLDNDPNTLLIVEQISSVANINLTDFAFHPGNSKLYGIDNNSGILYEFDTDSGNTTLIGDTGETGTFGAGYFDVNGYYYVSRNQDGQIFRIDLSDQGNISNGIVPAVKFAEGPSSSQNDGARCANAPVIDEDSNIDFGDAPDSYNTTLASNGPRHQIDGVTWLGAISPDGEQDGLVAPLSDDTVGLSDEDGVDFISTFQVGLDVMLNVQASTEGYLTAWFDWNQDGDFLDEGEYMVQDKLLESGTNSIVFTVPIDALEGQTWSRFRFSQQLGLSSSGGALSGEVEDHQLYVTSQGIYVRHYPSESSYATVAFEDNWPHLADYDMNDVVIHYRVTEILKEGEVKKSYIRGRLAALGADYHNGFAIRLAGLQRVDVDTALTRQYHNDQQQQESGLELDSAEAIFIISNDLNDNKGTQCRYFRTLSTCSENESFLFELHISLKENADVSTLMPMPYDPFIFATPNFYHGEEIPFQPGRSWEVHLPDQPPTEKFNRNDMWRLGVDDSDETNQKYFKTAQNLPWALLIPDEWNWPLERIELVEAYPKFAGFAESAGEINNNWFHHDEAKANTYYKR